MLSLAEENYLKQIFRLSRPGISVSTNAIAQTVQTKASSVTDMLNKLSAKKLIEYKKYQGVNLTSLGKKTALLIVRKHRLWEYFLAEKLKFPWENVHTIAEQLEHIQSDELIQKLDQYLGFPKFDPHGDPIPDKNGNLPSLPSTLNLTKGKVGVNYKLVAVCDDREEFLVFLNKTGIKLNCLISVKNRFEFNNTLELEIKSTKKTIILDESVQEKLLIQKK